MTLPNKEINENKYEVIEWLEQAIFHITINNFNEAGKDIACAMIYLDKLNENL